MAKTVWIIAARTIAYLTALGAAVVMLTNYQKVNFHTFTFEIGYTHYSAFKFFVIANGMGSSYNLLILFIPSGSMPWPLVVVLDLVITFLLLASCSSTIAILPLIYNGDSYVGWDAVCRSVPYFCINLCGALVLGWIAFLITLGLLLGSLHFLADPLLLPH